MYLFSPQRLIVKIKKIFFDANVFNDIFDENRDNHQYSKRAIEYALKNEIEIYTSCEIVTNIYYITSKYTSRDKALQAIELLNELVEIIPFAKEELDATVKLMKFDSDYKDMEDAIQYTLALQYDFDLILTNDKRFISKNIKSINAKKFLELSR